MINCWVHSHLTSFHLVDHEDNESLTRQVVIPEHIFYGQSGLTKYSGTYGANCPVNQCYQKCVIYLILERLTFGSVFELFVYISLANGNPKASYNNGQLFWAKDFGSCLTDRHTCLYFVTFKRGIKNEDGWVIMGNGHVCLRPRLSEGM